MDTIVLIFAVVAAVAASVGAIAAVALWRQGKRRAEVDLRTEFDKMIDNLEEAVSVLKQHTSERVDLSKEYVVGSFKSASDATIRVLELYMRKFSEEIAQINKVVEEKLTEVRGEMKGAVGQMRTELGESMNRTREESAKQLETVRATVDVSLTKTREDNAKQLEAMRATVDEKLSATLDTRVKSAFQLVNDRLDAVQKGFGEMRELSSKVGDLNRVFTNVKTRGGWGEIALESLLEQILSPDQYIRQAHVIPNGREAVDFAIVMPGQAGKRVYLPMDAKFPTSDYERLVEAAESGSVEETARARKALLDCVRREAKSIGNKYVQPPYTTPFAILYLPTEGLFAEVTRECGLLSELQQKHNITVCGPTTVTALLSSLQVGFTTLQIQRRSGEIVELMKAFRKEFTTFTDLLGKVRKNAVSVVNTLDDVGKRNDIIMKKLDKVNSIAAEADAENAAIEVAAELVDAGDVHEV